MISLDGAGGGGQILRTALSFAPITDTGFRIENIRSERPDPGLKPQHLTAVRLAEELCDAEVRGAEPGGDSLTFQPGGARRRSLQAAVGTAGSVALLFDVVLPIAAGADEAFRLTVTGGTDVKWAPTVEYHQLVKLPLLARCGVDATIDLAKTGFYPAGGGKATLQTTPSPLAEIELESRGSLDNVEIYSKAAEELATANVADRQASHAQETLAAAGLPAKEKTVEYVSTPSIGSALLLGGNYEQSLAGFVALGERGRSSEAVAERAVEQFTAFHATDGVVDSFMADQVMTFLALLGGRVRVPTVTAHVRSNLDVLAAFGSDISLDCGGRVLTASAL